MAKTFQRKPFEVTAEQVEIWTEVETPAGQKTVAPGDWIVTDGGGQITVLTAEEFATQYTAAAATVVAPEETAQVGLIPPVVREAPDLFFRQDPPAGNTFDVRIDGGTAGASAPSIPPLGDTPPAEGTAGTAPLSSLPDTTLFEKIAATEDQAPPAPSGASSEPGGI